MTDAETETPRHGTEASGHAPIVGHHFRSPWARIIQPLKIGVGGQGSEFLDLIHHEVSWLSVQHYPPSSTDEAWNRKPLRKMLVRMPFVVFGNCVLNDIEQQKHRGLSEQGHLLYRGY